MSQVLGQRKTVIGSAENRWVRLLKEISQGRFLGLITVNRILNDHCAYKQNGKFIDKIRCNPEKGLCGIKQNLIDPAERDVMKFNSAPWQVMNLQTETHISALHWKLLGWEGGLFMKRTVSQRSH